MRKTIVAAFTLLMLAGGAGAATAGHQDREGPGPNGHNNHGLCTAMFNGSEKGREKKAQAGPFEALIAESPDGPSDDDGAPGQQAGESGGSLSDAWDQCNNSAFNPKGVGGTPTNPNE